VVATGEAHSVREFCELAFAALDIPLTWEGEGTDEKGLDGNGRPVVQIDPRYYRPAEVDLLCGDASKAKRVLGWQPRVGFEELARMMVEHDLKLAQRE